MTRQNKSPTDPRQFEQFVGSVLRQQPLHQAPVTLEARVLRELALQAARPWWQLGFSRWPIDRKSVV